MVETKFMTMNRGRRNFKFISLVPRGGITWITIVGAMVVV